MKFYSLKDVLPQIFLIQISKRENFSDTDILFDILQQMSFKSKQGRPNITKYFELKF